MSTVRSLCLGLVMAIALVTHVAAGGTASTVTTGTMDSTGANFLATGVGSFSGQGTQTVTDSKSNSPWVNRTFYVGAISRVRLSYFANPGSVGSSHTATNAGTNAFPSAAFAAFSGVLATSPYDRENGATAAGATSIQPGSVTPAEPGSLLLVTLCTTAAITGLAITDGFTLLDSIAFSGGNHEGVSFWCLVHTSGAINPTISWTNAIDAAATITVFKPAASAANPYYAYQQN